MQGHGSRLEGDLPCPVYFFKAHNLLRHTYITNLLYAGVDPKTVQYLAGHENSKTTMDIYARVKYNKPEELFEVVNDALNQENLDEKSPISMVKE